MVQEVRDILLGLDEVQSAFLGYQRIVPDFLPKGKIMSCRIVDESVRLMVEMAYGDTRQSSEIVYKGLDVLKPLIRFCIENNIMLPRDGKKSILYKDDKIIMHIELDLSMHLTTSINPMRVSDMKETVKAPEDTEPPPSKESEHTAVDIIRAVRATKGLVMQAVRI